MPRYERIDGRGTTIVVAADNINAPRLIHFGARLPDGLDLKEIDAATAVGPRESTPDAPIPPTLFPAAGMGWLSEPALSGVHAAGDGAVSWAAGRVEKQEQSLIVHLEDPRTQIRAQLMLAMDPVTGMLASRATVHNDSRAVFSLRHAASLYLPLPSWALELLTLTGEWSREGQPHRIRMTAGTWSQSNRTGRTGFSGSTFAVVEPSSGDCSGRIIAVHLAWSGNHRLAVETLPSGQRMASAGLLLGPGEAELGPGQAFETPTAYACFSERGLNGVSDVFHPFVRAAILPPVTDPIRRVHFNSWEAAYFSFDEASLKELASAAAALGVERFVLDDGWFAGRRNDASSLGDWRVDQTRFPRGLAPLTEHIRALGMDVGLWVEPEMVSPDSDLYRAYPDWCLHAPGAHRPTMRNQLWLDMSREDVRDHLFVQLDRLLTDNDIAYLKWDCNRFQFPAVSRGTPAATRVIRGTYALLDRLRRHHPDVEIESCASGGARIDLEILKRARRVWPSDTTDAIERLRIQRWAGLILPPETLGAHVGPSPNPITGRRLSMAFRARIAMFGHLGVELDPRKLDADDHGALAFHIALYKQHRRLIHSGRYLAWQTDDGADARMCISETRDEALALLCRASVGAYPETAPVRFPGLDRAAYYRVSLPDPWPEIAQRRMPDHKHWRLGPRFSAQVLEEIGLRLPAADPETAWLVHLVRD